MPSTEGKRIQIPIVVEMTAEQAKAWARANGIATRPDGSVVTKDLVDDVRNYALVGLQHRTALGDFATITLK